MPFLPHEEVHLAFFSSGGSHVSRLLSTRGRPELEESYAAWLLAAAHTPAFGNGGFPDRSRVWLRAPVRVGDTVAGVVVLFAHPNEHYGADDLARARWFADLVAVLLADGEFTSDRDEVSLDPSQEVLHEIAQVLDVRPVFPRISAIVKRVLPHDRLTMTFHEADGHIGIQAVSNMSAPVFSHVQVDPAILAQPFVLFPDISPTAMADYEPAEARQTLLDSGFRSFLAINVRARDQRLGVEFWSKYTNGFTIADVPLARRIANYVALAVAHEQLAIAPPGPEKLQARDLQLDRRVHSVSSALEHSGRAPIVGESERWKPVLRSATRVADTEATVLLTGESGSGKEVIARFIHAASRRSKGPFAAVNCAALPEQLLESELFGYERGAFTGATQAKPGQIELAAGGVLFLDEVSEMSPTAQAKFLRVLQEGEFRRLGGTRLLKSDVRVIAATNTDLRQAIEHGRFRRDLYYRLRVFDLCIPPLRERTEDILLLSGTLLLDICKHLGRGPTTLTKAARSALLSYPWPGNVRELRNVLERAAILCDADAIDVGDLSFDDDSAGLPIGTTNLVAIERETIEKVMRDCNGNKSWAAKRLGLSRMQLYVRLRRYQTADNTVQ